FALTLAPKQTRGRAGPARAGADRRGRCELASWSSITNSGVAVANRTDGNTYVPSPLSDGPAAPGRRERATHGTNRKRCIAKNTQTKVCVSFHGRWSVPRGHSFSRTVNGIAGSRPKEVRRFLAAPLLGFSISMKASTSRLPAVPGFALALARRKMLTP